MFVTVAVVCFFLYAHSSSGVLDMVLSSRSTTITWKPWMDLLIFVTLSSIDISPSTCTFGIMVYTYFTSYCILSFLFTTSFFSYQIFLFYAWNTSLDATIVIHYIHIESRHDWIYCATLFCKLCRTYMGICDDINSMNLYVNLCSYICVVGNSKAPSDIFKFQRIVDVYDSCDTDCICFVLSICSSSILLRVILVVSIIFHNESNCSYIFACISSFLITTLSNACYVTSLTWSPILS